MSNLYACINVYDDAWALEECIKSVRQGARDAIIVVVDGAYAQFPHLIPHSTDGTIQLAHALADVIIETTDAWLDEVTKRNRYLIGAVGDSYLVIDADEELSGNLPPLDYDDVDIPLLRKSSPNAVPGPIYRYFKHRPGIHYSGTHHSLWSEGILLNKRPHGVASGCYLLHKDAEREKAQSTRVSINGQMMNRLEQKQVYYSLLTETEKQFRRDHQV